MGSELNHEAVLTSTGFRISLQQDNQCGRRVNTHVDGADPFSFLLRIECSPFFPYSRFCTGTWIRVIRTRHDYCGPKNGQSNRKSFADEHFLARCCKNGYTDPGFIYWLAKRHRQEEV